MRERERYLGADAGPYRLALPLSSVRQILDVGAGDASSKPGRSRLAALDSSLPPRARGRGCAHRPILCS